MDLSSFRRDGERARILAYSSADVCLGAGI
jgi:hypothetical protein